MRKQCEELGDPDSCNRRHEMTKDQIPGLSKGRFDGIILQDGCRTLHDNRTMSEQMYIVVIGFATHCGESLTKDPIMIGGAWLCMTALDLKTPATKAIPQKAPIKDQVQLTTFPIL